MANPYILSRDLYPSRHIIMIAPGQSVLVDAKQWEEYSSKCSGVKSLLERKLLVKSKGDATSMVVHEGQLKEQDLAKPAMFDEELPLNERNVVERNSKSEKLQLTPKEGSR